MIAQTSNLQLNLAEAELDITVRPIEKSDRELEKDFIEKLSPESRHYRFLGGVNKLSDSDIEKLCDVNHHDSMAFVAVQETGGKPEQIGVVRYESDQSGGACEMALTVADEFKNTELPELLMKKILRYAKEHGVAKIYSTEFRDNKAMKNLAKKFSMQAIDEPGTRSEVRYVLEL